METQNFIRLSRRSLLRRGTGLLVGTLLTKLVGKFDASPLFSQIAPKRIYIAPDDHTDYLWTADEETYRQAFLEMLEYYLDLADQTINDPNILDEHQSRWSCDGSFWMWTYQKNKTTAEFEKLIERIKSGHITVPLNALCVCLGGAPAEAVLRGMYYPGQIERRYDVSFPLAYTVENQTQPYGLVSLWTGSGVKYSWKGICGCASKVTFPGDRDHEIYWWIGPDESKILMKWYSLNNNQSLGGYAEAYNPSTAVELLDSKCFSTDYNYGVAAAFGRGWDHLKTLTDEFVTVAKAKTNSTRTVIVSNEQDFFEDFEETYGTSLPSVSTSFGNEWELYCASMAEVSAQVKRAVEKLRNAEALATLVTLQNPGFMNGRQEMRDLAWMNLGLYWEHDWTADGPVPRETRRDWQRRIAGEITDYVDTLHADATSALGGMIQKNGAIPRFYTFNSLSWTRTDIADCPYDGAQPVYVIDLSTGQETPSQLVNIDGQQYLRILAQDIPAVGYKVFEIQQGQGQNYPGGPSANASTGSIENSFYQLTIAERGAITSLKDKTQSNRQFAKNIGSYFINDLGSASGNLVVENAGPVSVTLRATASNPLNHTTYITLVRNSSRIDIRNEITENFSSTYKWRFGFELNNPDLWHEEVGAIIRAKLLADGGHYSPRNARYDWLTLNHFADMSGIDGAGVTLSNADCYYVQFGNSTPTALDVNTPQISPLVGGQVDGSNLGIQNQGGDTYFLQRFALKTHSGFDPVAAMKFALEHQNPLVTGQVTGSSPAYPEKSFSFLTIDNPNVLLWALKPADDGIDQGIITRVWNLSSTPQAFSLTLPSTPIVSTKQTTHIETPLKSLSVAGGVLSDSLATQQLKTFLISTGEFDKQAYLPFIVKNEGD